MLPKNRSTSNQQMISPKLTFNQPLIQAEKHFSAEFRPMFHYLMFIEMCPLINLYRIRHQVRDFFLNSIASKFILKRLKANAKLFQFIVRHIFKLLEASPSISWMTKVDMPKVSSFCAHLRWQNRSQMQGISSLTFKFVKYISDVVFALINCCKKLAFIELKNWDWPQIIQKWMGF